MRAQSVLIAILLLIAVAHTRGQTFYDVLKADPQHKLIMKAVDADPEGKMKQMLQDTAPVTAFVPIDKAFIKSAMKLKLVKPSDSAAFMKNHCLITAILKQHMVPGRYDSAALKELNSKPSMLVTKKMVPNTKGKVTVSWPLKIAAGSDGGISVASAAKTPDPSNPSKQVPATQAQLIPPFDVPVGSGIIHNIDGLLLPMTNLTRLIQITGCK